MRKHVQVFSWPYFIRHEVPNRHSLFAENVSENVAENVAENFAENVARSDILFYGFD